MKGPHEAALWQLALALIFGLSVGVLTIQALPIGDPHAQRADAAFRWRQTGVLARHKDLGRYHPLPRERGFNAYALRQENSDGVDISGALKDDPNADPNADTNAAGDDKAGNGTVPDAASGNNHTDADAAKGAKNATADGDPAANQGDDPAGAKDGEAGAKDDAGKGQTGQNDPSKTNAGSGEGDKAGNGDVGASQNATAPPGKTEPTAGPAANKTTEGTQPQQCLVGISANATGKGHTWPGGPPGSVNQVGAALIQAIEAMMAAMGAAGTSKAQTNSTAGGDRPIEPTNHARHVRQVERQLEEKLRAWARDQAKRRG